jgi:O-antigen ligase
MPPRLAAVLCGFGILGLLYLNREEKDQTSPAIWIAVAWLSIGSSRTISQWLSTEAALASADRYVDGSPTDRFILSGLLICGLLILIRRSRRTLSLLKENIPILLFFGFCAMSVLWSDFPLVALKRWTKTLGNLTMVFLVLTDRNSVSASKQLLCRTGFLLIPLSVLLVKYYPDLGRGYNGYTWTTFYCGVSTDKNGLGTLCLVFGLASFWCFVQAFRDKNSARRVRLLIAHSVVLAMTLWLFLMAESSTSVACFVIGSGIILITTLNKRSTTVHIIAALIGCIASLACLSQETYVRLVSALGRDASLTGRTDIWNDLLRMDFNHWIGTGFESFWLGPRLEYLWSRYYFQPNQAHNGYIEIYLTLGVVGLALLGMQFIVGYRNAVAALRQGLPFASLQLAFVAVAAIYNVTEAAFKVMHPLWIAFSLSIIATLIRVPVKRHAFGWVRVQKCVLIVNATDRSYASRSNIPGLLHQ